MTSHNNKIYSICSVDKALNLIEQFHQDEGELGLIDLSSRLQLPKSYVFRLLVTLQSRNYVEQNMNTAKYRLGFKNLTLGLQGAKHLGVLKKSRLIMEEMVRGCNETICISIMKDYSIINLDAVECDHSVRVTPRIGVPLPAYCTAAGKAQIAYYSDDKLKMFVLNNEFQKYTSNTIINRDHFRQQLRQVAQNGYAIELEELDLGVACIGASIRDFSSNIVGAVTCVVPTHRFTDNRMRKDLIPLVTKGAVDISTQLGYQ